MANEIALRRAEKRDAEILAGFNVALARETEGKEIPPETVAAGVRSLLEQPEHGFYIVAESRGEVVAGLMVTFEWSDWRNGVFWWVQSVYVRPEFRRQGLYRRLYQHVKALAAGSRSNVCGFRLYVERENSVARKTYEALGMREAPYKVYEEERSPTEPTSGA